MWMSQFHRKPLTVFKIASRSSPPLNFATSLSFQVLDNCLALLAFGFKLFPRVIEGFLLFLHFYIYWFLTCRSCPCYVCYQIYAPAFV